MQTRNKIKLIFILSASVFSCKTADRLPFSKPDTDGVISVEYPEVYELANIVLALTDYGITDKWQVRKDFAYYEEMRKYFEPYMGHPLLDSVNFSRERWEEYLSYRTDSYAFELDGDSRLKRRNNFQSFDIKTFDEFKSLTEDFARKSNFRVFFKERQEYRQQIIQRYRDEYLLAEMKAFLTKEFGDFFGDKKYSIVISPFVYAQNLHRDIDSNWTADFPTIAKPVIEGRKFENKEDKSAEIHTLFTEMDHGYVNPTTEKYDIKARFDEKLWDDESGYSNSGNAVFNEYMTWAVFDIFNSIYFPEFAGKVNLNWHFQNDTRGFIYSDLFASKLKEIYNKYKGRRKIKDLYPELLEWTKEIQPGLSKPLLLNDSDTLYVSPSKNAIELQFSEPMKKVDSFDLVLHFSQWDKEVVNVSGIKWDEDGRSVSFELELPQKEEYYLLLNWWGVQKPLMSQKGIMLRATSGFLIKGNSAQNKG